MRPTPPALKEYGGQISQGYQSFAEAGGESSLDVQGTRPIVCLLTILSVKKSALVTRITELIHCIHRDKIVFKTRIAGNKEFATNFIFPVDIRIQR